MEKTYRQFTEIIAKSAESTFVLKNRLRNYKIKCSFTESIYLSGKNLKNLRREYEIIFGKFFTDFNKPPTNKKLNNFRNGVLF